MDVHIIILTMDAYDAVMALWERVEGVGLHDDTDSRDGIRAYLERNPGMSFVAVRAGVVVGAVLSGNDGRRGYIHHLAVASECRRQGIGRRLIDSCLEAQRAAGISKCHVFVYCDNKDGIAFWESHGWHRRSAEITVMSRDVDAGATPQLPEAAP